MQNEQFVYSENGSVVASEPAHSLERFTGAYIKIEAGYNETTFRLESETQTSTATINSEALKYTDTLVHAENVNDNTNLSVNWVRHTMGV
jgi:hypothetical protein